MNAEELKSLLELLRDARHRVANKSQAGALKADFDRLDKPVLERLDAQIIKIEVKLLSLQQKDSKSKLSARHTRIRDCILASFANGSTEWESIVAVVKESGPEIKNWLEVRRILQALINEKLVLRDPRVDKELYHRVKFK